MTPSTKDRGGSFSELKANLPLFDDPAHRHDRGWPHSQPKQGDESTPKRRWKTVGIFHFPHHDEDDPGDEARNADSC
jgi:hypothetical protein